VKITEFVSKVAGGGLLTLSVIFLGLYAAGPLGQAPLFSGLACGAGGLWLLSRREHVATLPDDVAARLKRLEAAVATTQQDLAVAQEELKEITEERNFLRQLRAGATEAEYRSHPVR
jgi:hypothetical protein